MREALKQLLETEVEALGCELVDLEFHAHRGGGLLRLYIDHPAGDDPAAVVAEVTVDDCESVSRRVSEVLDAADPIKGEYTLEVSSPGFDRPLTKAAHFARFVGSRVHVETSLPRDNRRRWTGQLTAAADGRITLIVDGKNWEFGIGELKSARVVPEYGARRE